MDLSIPDFTDDDEHVRASQRIADPLRQVLMLVLIPVVFGVTMPLALLPLLRDPMGFGPVSILGRVVLIAAVAVATAAPIFAGSNAASLAASNNLAVRPKALRRKTIDVMGWTWAIMAGLTPATLMALLHQRIGFMVFWCFHGGGEDVACLPVNYQVAVPEALPNILPTFGIGLAMTLTLTWAAVRLGVMVGRRVRKPGRAVLWVTGQMIVAVVVVLVASFAVMHNRQQPELAPGEFEVVQPADPERRIDI